MGATKQGWIKRKLNGNGIAWNKGKRGLQVAWNKGKNLKEYPTMGFQKGHPSYLSKETRKRISENMKGEKHWNWKGGLTPLVMQIRHCYKYRQWVSDVFTRDDFICQVCGVRGKELEAHHIKRFKDILYESSVKTLKEALEYAEFWNINNGQTMCLKCHNKTKNPNLTYTA
jgi:hypothetical protein